MTSSGSGPGEPAGATPARDERGRWRVAVTGLGVKTPAGCDVKTMWDTMLGGRSVTGPVTNFDPGSLPVRIATEVRDFEPLAYLSAKTIRRMDKITQMGFAAAMDAVTDAGGVGTDVDRYGIVFGTGTGGIETLGDQAIISATGGTHLVSPLLVPMMMPNATNAFVSIELGWTGPSFAVASACASGTTAIGEAAKLIRYGDCDAVLAGGGEHSVNIYAMSGFIRTGALSGRNDDPARASRPFDLNRDGYVMGEGAAFLVLERMDLALARNAHVYAEVVGYGMTSDAHHLTAPRPDGQRAAACIRRALADAGLPPEAIGQVNAHGTSTHLNDAMEARAIRQVFGADGPPVTGSKGVFGHLMGAAGAAESVVSVLSAERGVVPPTANYEDPDPECDLDVVAGAPRPVGRRPVLSNSFGFGGHNACLVFAPSGTADAEG